MTVAEEAGNHEQKGIHLDGGSLVILFIIVTLTFGVIGREINKRIGFPYTPLLIIFGAVLGGWQHFGYISDSTDNMRKIDPHSILILLLPLLIFESAYNAHTEVLTKNFWQVVLLVGPGVLFQTFFLGTLIYYALDYQADMSYESCLILGTILATTDPVAVVALLKELGAPLHIETLIEMESLFNDGIAMVFFNIFVDLAQGDKLTAENSLGRFVSMSVGGPLTGVAFGLLSLIVLQLFTRGTTIFITLVVLVPYSSFLVCEKFLEGKVSGLLNLVIVGIIMNVYCKDYMTNQQKTAVGHILQYLQYVSETVLFFMSGVFIGDVLINQSGGDGKDGIGNSEWWKLIVLYLFLTIARALMFFLLKWPLNKIGQGMSWKECIAATWGGLRGALAIALGLIIYADTPNEDGITRKTQNLILFHVCGISTLTLIINGSTCGQLVQFLGLIPNTDIKLKFKVKYLNQIYGEGKKQKEQLNQNPYFDMVEWKGVDDLVDLAELEKQGWQDTLTSRHNKKKTKTVATSKSLSNIVKVETKSKDLEKGSPKTDKLKGFLAKSITKTNSEIKQKELQKSNLNHVLHSQMTQIRNSDEQLKKLRYEAMRTFMQNISHVKSKEWMSKRIFQLIFDAAEENTEHLEKPISMWPILEETLASDKKLQILSDLQTFPFHIGKIINYWFHLEVEHIHEMIYIFNSCVSETRAVYGTHYIHNNGISTQLKKDYKQISEELDIDQKAAKKRLTKLKKNYFQVLGKLEQRKAAQKIIMAQAKMVDMHIGSNYIPEKEGAQIKNYLSTKLGKLSSIKTLVHLSSQCEVTIEKYFKDTIDHNQLKMMIDGQRKEFLQGEVIDKLDEEAAFLYFIVDGQIEEEIMSISGEKKHVEYITGKVVGLINLVNREQKSIVTLTAKEDTTVLKFYIDEFQDQMDNNSQFEEFCLRKCFYQLVHLSKNNDDIWKKFEVMNHDEIDKLGLESQCLRIDANEEGDKQYRVDYGGYLLYGELLITEDGMMHQELLTDFDLIPTGDVTIQAKSQSIMLIFPQPKSMMNDQHLKPQIARKNMLKLNDSKNMDQMSMSRQKNNMSQLPRLKMNNVEITYDQSKQSNNDIKLSSEQTGVEQNLIQTVNGNRYNMNTSIQQNNQQQNPTIQNTPVRKSVISSGVKNGLTLRQKKYHNNFLQNHEKKQDDDCARDDELNEGPKILGDDDAVEMTSVQQSQLGARQSAIQHNSPQQNGQYTNLEDMSLYSMNQQLETNQVPDSDHRMLQQPHIHKHISLQERRKSQDINPMKLQENMKQPSDEVMDVDIIKGNGVEAINVKDSNGSKI